MTRVARTSGPSMGPLHVQLYTERLPTLLRCSGHQETSGSNAAASALKSGGIAGTLLDVAMISCDQKRGGTVSHFVKGSRWLTWRVKKKVRASHRNDVCRPCDAFQLNVKRLYLRRIRLRQQHSVNNPEATI